MFQERGERIWVPCPGCVSVGCRASVCFLTSGKDMANSGPSPAPVADMTNQTGLLLLRSLAASPPPAAKTS